MNNFKINIRERIKPRSTFVLQAKDAEHGREYSFYSDAVKGYVKGEFSTRGGALFPNHFFFREQRSGGEKARVHGILDYTLIKEVIRHGTNF